MEIWPSGNAQYYRLGAEMNPVGEKFDNKQPRGAIRKSSTTNFD